MAKKLSCLGIALIMLFSLAACSCNCSQARKIALEFSLDGLAIKTITHTNSKAMKPPHYSRYDFERLEFSTWDAQDSFSENPYSEPVIEMTFNKEQAITFLDDLENAGLFQMERYYTLNQTTLDGGGWSIEVELANGDIFISGGWNAYPPVTIQKGMDDAVSALGNPKRFWLSAEHAENYGYSQDFVGSNTHDSYPGCTVRIDLKHGINWVNNYRNSKGNAIDENYRLQRLVDMKKYYTRLSAEFIYDAEEFDWQGNPRIIKRIKPKFFEFSQRFEDEGLIYSVDLNPYLPHIRIDFYSNQRPYTISNVNYFESVVNNLVNELKKLNTVESADVYWVPSRS